MQRYVRRHETEPTMTFDKLPNEIRVHIVSFLNTKSLCFFAATSKRSFGNALDELRKRQHSVLAEIQIGGGRYCLFYYTLYGLYACGENYYGQLGLGHNKVCREFTQLEGLPGTIRQVFGEEEYTLVLTDQGLYACGDNRYGQLGLGHNNNCNRFTQVEDLPGIILQVTAGTYHALVLTDQGLYACGQNEGGELGLGHNNNCNRFTQVEDLPGAIQQVVAGDSYTFVLTDQGLYACGGNFPGQLGLGDNNDRNKFTLVRDLPGTIRQVAAGSLHTHILTDQGLYACGNNGYGELGLGDNNNRNKFTLVRDLPGTVLQVATGTAAHHSLALTDQGLYACGRNWNCQLGLGGTAHRNRFTQIKDLPGTIFQVAVNGYHTFMLTDQGLYICGNGYHDQRTRCFSRFTQVDELPFETKQRFLLPRYIKRLVAMGENFASKEEQPNHLETTTIPVEKNPINQKNQEVTAEETENAREKEKISETMLIHQ